MANLRRKLIIRGEPEGLRIGGEILPAAERGQGRGLIEPARTVPTPFATVRIEDEGRVLYVVAHKGVISDAPELWSIGTACPVVDELPRWHIRQVSPAGKPSLELHITLSLNSAWRVLDAD